MITMYVHKPVFITVDEDTGVADVIALPLNVTPDEQSFGLDSFKDAMEYAMQHSKNIKYDAVYTYDELIYKMDIDELKFCFILAELDKRMLYEIDDLNRTGELSKEESIDPMGFDIDFRCQNVKFSANAK